jgi:hypothetical protein
MEILKYGRMEIVTKARASRAQINRNRNQGALQIGHKLGAIASKARRKPGAN